MSGASMDAASWDERYAASGLVWSAAPNALAAELLADLPPGRALDVAAGEGRMALWLAGRGWDVCALDFSRAGLAKGRALAQQQGLVIDWRVADATTDDLGQHSFDLVLMLYLHLARPVMRDLLRRGQQALTPGGHLLVLGHDRDNLTRGSGGPQDPDLLYDTDLLAPGPDLKVLRREQVERTVGSGRAIDTLLLARRPDSVAPDEGTRP